MQKIQIVLSKQTKDEQLEELKAFLKQVQITRITIVKQSWLRRLFGKKMYIQIDTE